MILLATKSFSTKPDHATMVGLYLAVAVVCFVAGTLMAVSGRLMFATPAFLLGFAAAGKFLKEQRLFLWRSGTLADEEELIPGQMSRAEARKILGVRDGASPGDIRTAYKKLMLEHHPDREGNADFAKKINEARDTLLRKK